MVRLWSLRVLGAVKNERVPYVALRQLGDIHHNPSRHPC